MSGHTQGPWEQHALLSPSENDKGFRVTAFDGRDGRMWIADVSPVIDNERGDASEEGKANARLIAASPDLLAALKRYVEHDDTNHEPGNTFWQQIKDEALAAIAKAEGK
jgi:hypothetical protein